MMGQQGYEHGSPQDAHLRFPLEAFEKQLVAKMANRGTSWSLHRMLQKYEQPNSEGTLGIDELSAVLRLWNLEAPPEQLRRVAEGLHDPSMPHARTRQLQGPRIHTKTLCARLSHFEAANTTYQSSPLTGTAAPRPDLDRDHFRHGHRQADPGVPPNNYFVEADAGPPSAASSPALPSTPKSPVVQDLGTQLKGSPYQRTRQHALSEGLDDQAFFRKFEDLMSLKILERKGAGNNGLFQSFRMFDRTGKGSLTAGELGEACERLNIALTPDELRKLMARYDANGDGSIDMQEFAQFLLPDKFQRHVEEQPGLAAAHERVTSTSATHRLSIAEFERLMSDKLRSVSDGHHALRRAFQAFDQDTDGRITFDEFRHGLTRFNLEPTDASMLAIWQKYDPMGLGYINFNEFAGVFGFVDRQYFGGAKEFSTTLSHFAGGEEPARAVGAEHAARLPDANMSIQQFERMLNEKLMSRGSGQALGVRKAFRLFDVAGDGKITYEQFRDVLGRRFNMQMDDAFFKRLMQKYDENGDGVIDYNEFCTGIMPEVAQAGASPTQVDPLVRPWGDCTNLRTEAWPHHRSPRSADGNRAATKNFMVPGQIEKMLREKLLSVSGGTTKGLRGAFQKFNPSWHSGMSYEDFRRGLRAYHIEPSEEDLARLCAAFDPDRDGVIEFSDFVARIVPQTESSEWLYTSNRPFTYSTPGTTHHLGIQDFETFLKGRLLADVQNRRGPSLWPAVMRKVDINNTGWLSPEDFKQLLLQYNFYPSEETWNRLMQRYADQRGIVECRTLVAAVLEEAPSAPSAVPHSVF